MDDLFRAIPLAKFGRLGIGACNMISICFVDAGMCDLTPPSTALRPCQGYFVPCQSVLVSSCRRA